MAVCFSSNENGVNYGLKASILVKVDVLFVTGSKK
jgi:hypothetical protein